MLRQALLGVSRSKQIEKAVSALPVWSELAARFVAGESPDEAVLATERLVAGGLIVTIDHLPGEIGVTAAVDAYTELLGRLSDAGLTRHAEVSVNLSAVGPALPGDGDKIALENARMICRAARDGGSTVTLGPADHTSTDATLAILAELRRDFPGTGVALPAELRRTEADCRDLAHAGSRVRLCEGDHAEPAAVAYRSARDIGTSYVRCLKVLMNGAGYPMIASRDPRLIEIAGSLADRAGRRKDSFEYQFRYGVRPDEQVRLAGAGNTVRVHVPYGAGWHGYLVRRLAERPADLWLLLRSLVRTG